MLVIRENFPVTLKHFVRVPLSFFFLLPPPSQLTERKSGRVFAGSFADDFFFFCLD